MIHRMAKLIACVSIILVVLVVLSGSSPNCCTEYHPSQLPVKALKNYRIQKDTDNCNIKAVIFKTKKNILVCTDPDSKWVQRAMEFVPEFVPRKQPTA